jgi:glycosyltransferase involved in cell wall biosynthesis
MKIVHLMASPFFGGPERQMLGLAKHLPATTTSFFLTFAESGKGQAFLDQVQAHGFQGMALEHNTPDLRLAAQEIARRIQKLGADLLTCSGYKPDIIGWLAARQAGIPVVSISHGWTAATLKVRIYETMDRLVLHGMDAIVCVSEAQAGRVRRAMVPAKKIVMIRNAIDPDAFASPDPAYSALLRQFFPSPVKHIVGAAGRLSPEKGFGQLVDAAALVGKLNPDIGFVHFGDGPERSAITRQIAARGLRQRFILAGFRSDATRFFPFMDLMVLPSYTEGLPVVLLESFAAGVPAVASAVGGTPEVLSDGLNGYLVPPGDSAALAQRILHLLADEPRRQAMGRHARQHVVDHFNFAAQAAQYQKLFDRLVR